METIVMTHITKHTINFSCLKFMQMTTSQSSVSMQMNALIYVANLHNDYETARDEACNMQ